MRAGMTHGHGDKEAPSQLHLVYSTEEGGERPRSPLPHTLPPPFHRPFHSLFYGSFHS